MDDTTATNLKSCSRLDLFKTASMKLFISILSIAYLSLLNSGLALAADCPEASYTLTTQAEVDNFPADCDTVTGDLTVQGGGITNLNGLANLSVVGKNLLIIDNPGIRFLRLPALTQVGREIRIANNTALQSLEGLRGLTSALWIDIRNALVTDLDDLSNLRALSYLYLEDLDRLQNIDGLANITSIEDLWIRDLNALETIDGARNITQHVRSVWIHNNDSLTNIDALSGITSLSRRLYITDNDNLTSISGIRNVKSSGAVHIWGNRAVQTIPTLALRKVNPNHHYYEYWGFRFHGNGARDLDCSGLGKVLGHPVGPPYDGVDNGIDGDIKFRDDDRRELNCGGYVEAVIPPLHRPEEMAQLYIGFLGRAPDPAGLVYWTNELAGFGSSESAVSTGLKKLANDITFSSEWFNGIGSYDPLTQSGAEAIVAEMYLNLFSRPATASDLEYWSYDLTSQHVTAAQMAVLLITGAKAKQNADWTVLNYKHEAALYYVATVNDATFDRSTARLSVKDVNDWYALQDSKEASDKL